MTDHCLFAGTTQPRVLPDRHLSDCEDCECPGCVQCPEAHCWDDGTHLGNQYPVTCPACVDRHRDMLADILDGSSRLPAEALEHPTSEIPGGAAMVMLGPYSNGGVDQLLRWADPDTEHRLQSLDLLSDPEPPLSTLATWEDDWREQLGHKGGPVATVESCIDYLRRHLTWASQRHDAYEDFIDDLRRLRNRLVAVLGDSNPDVTGVKCLNSDCGGDLRNHYYRPDPVLCRHRAEAWKAHVTLTYWQLVLVSYPELGSEHQTCLRDQGGRRDWWTCNACGRDYHDDEYRRAVAQAHLDHQPFRSAGQIHQMLGIPASTLRTWVQRGDITRYDNPDRPGHALYHVQEVRGHAQRGGLLAS